MVFEEYSVAPVMLKTGDEFVTIECRAALAPLDSLRRSGGKPHAVNQFSTIRFRLEF
jgi:hypothetical protein